MTQSQAQSATLDAEEIARFGRLAAEWWDAEGPFRPLHRINPVRLTYIRDQICRHFARDPKTQKSLSGLSVLDIGCGGGLVCEPLTRLGASVTGIDPAHATIEAAKAHARASNLDIEYEATTAEDYRRRRARATMSCCCSKSSSMCRTSRPSSKRSPLWSNQAASMILSTLNRTLKAYALAIVGAEYILRWLPIGTHQWERFVRPEELGVSLERGRAQTHRHDRHGL